jgi:hypothetical protein
LQTLLFAEAVKTIEMNPKEDLDSLCFQDSLLLFFGEEKERIVFLFDGGGVRQNWTTFCNGQRCSQMNAENHAVERWRGFNPWCLI